MASAVTGFTVVVCHGSYHTPAPYGPLIEALKARGIDAYCPQLPTADLAKLNVGDVNNPDFDLEPPGKKVLVIAHSSGGWVATEAARPELQAKTREANGARGGIIGILYMGAFVIPVGESIHSFFQPKDGNAVVPPFMTFHKHGFTGLGTIVQAEKFLFNDLKPADAQKWAPGLTASPILTTKLSNDAYSALPCAYPVLEGDLTLPKEYQEGMAALQGSKTGEFTIYRSPAGHSPHLSWNEGVVDTAVDFVKKIQG